MKETQPLEFTSGQFINMMSYSEIQKEKIQAYLKLKGFYVCDKGCDVRESSFIAFIAGGFFPFLSLNSRTKNMLLEDRTSLLRAHMMIDSAKEK